MMSTGVNSARFARPYARAAFDYAQAHNRLAQWGDMLREMAARVQLSMVADILKSPRYSAQTRGEVVLALGQGILDEPGQNFVKTLAAYKRLSVLPEIFLLFEQLRAAAEKTLQVRVKSAITLTDAQLAKLSVSLAKKWGQPVQLEQELDPALVGGFTASAGDRVVDYSIRGQLDRLRHALAG